MPTITYIRFWCTKCEEFTLHYTGKNHGCKECGIVTETYKLSDVPKEKLLEQRKRYNEQQHQYLMNKISQPFSALNGFSESMFKDVADNVKIIEDDAGQKKIDSDRRMEAERKRRESTKEKEKYKGLRRNDICICGSGIKYKKCCLRRIEKL